MVPAQQTKLRPSIASQPNDCDLYRLWSLASLSEDDLVTLAFDGDSLGIPSGVPETDTVQPESAMVKDGELHMLTYSRKTGNWYLLIQNRDDSLAEQVRCEVDTGSGWEHVYLEEAPEKPATALQTRGNVCSLPGPPDDGLDDLDISEFMARMG